MSLSNCLPLLDKPCEQSLSIKSKDVTFKNNKLISIHRWYPYIEGFSEGFVKSILDNYNKTTIIYDPFNGSGTTTLTCSYSGYKSLASEVNPLMRFVANTKVNSVKNILAQNKFELLELTKNEFLSLNKVNWKKIKISDHINPCYLHMDFFDIDNLKQISLLKSQINLVNDNDIKDLLNLSLASIAVDVSKMIRAADLRRKTENELILIEKNAIIKFNEKFEIIVNDIKSLCDKTVIEKMEIISDNAKLINNNYAGYIDIVITSPPYVNGTNYFRNTKLELWLLDFIKEEGDLKKYRTSAITAGINNVSNEIDSIKFLNFVEDYACCLDKVSPDKRIPKMIRAYFSDMDKVFNNLNILLKNKGKIYFDIGDSEYYGVHIPVDQIIEKIACLNGFEVLSSNITRSRKSKSGKLLSQKLIIFNKISS